MAERFVDPSGRTWVVRRQWIPRLGHETLWGRFHRRFRQSAKRAGEVADADPGCAVDIAEGIVVALAVIAIVLLLLFVGFPLVVALVEVVGLVLLAVLGVVGRVLFRRPWIIEARADDGTEHEWRVVGWRASGEHAEMVASSLRSGIVPPA